MLSAHSAQYAADLTCEPTSGRVPFRVEASGAAPDTGRKSQTLQTSLEGELLSARSRVEESPRPVSAPPGHARYSPTQGRSSNPERSELVAHACIGITDADSIAMDVGSGGQDGRHAKEADASQWELVRFSIGSVSTRLILPSK